MTVLKLQIDRNYIRLLDRKNCQTPAVKLQIQRNLALFLTGILLSLLLFWINGSNAYAAVVYENPDTGYEIIIEDEANLLSEEEKMVLAEEMQEISVYGNAAFVTIEQNHCSSTEKYISDYYQEHFGTGSGTVFLIDMDYRKIWIYSNGRIYQTITNSYADIITDNSYTYATQREYYQCASKVFHQILTLLKGEKIAQPMKYISNACLAVVLALIINYFIVMFYSRSRKPSETERFNGISMQFKFHNPEACLVSKTKRYSPVQSNHSGRSSGGGGSSGGSSGGGGGHSF